MWCNIVLNCSSKPQMNLICIANFNFCFLLKVNNFCFGKQSIESGYMFKINGFYEYFMQHLIFPYSFLSDAICFEIFRSSLRILQNLQFLLNLREYLIIIIANTSYANHLNDRLKQLLRD